MIQLTDGYAAYSRVHACENYLLAQHSCMVCTTLSYKTALKQQALVVETVKNVFTFMFVINFDLRRTLHSSAGEHLSPLPWEGTK